MMDAVGHTGDRPLCLTIGNFDGVHAGHRSLIDLTLRIAESHNLASAIMTFWPHPRAVLHGPQAHCPLTTRSDRLKLLGASGAGRIIEIPFSRELAALSPEEFINSCLVPLSLRKLVVGHDFTLGKDRAGTVEALRILGKKHGFAIIQAEAFLIGNEPVSSTRLRQAISKGDMDSAAAMLGRPYSIAGKVTHGQARGRLLGFPTANLANVTVLLPPPGVYATTVLTGNKSYPAVTNIGTNPTFGNRAITVESFLLDTSVNLYDQTIRIQFLAYLREERAFASAGQLTRQIEKDVEEARLIHQHASPTDAISPFPMPENP